MTAISIDYASRPSALRYMAQALWPGRGWRDGRGIPRLSLTWHGYQIAPSAIDTLVRLSGSASPSMATRLAILAPHVTGFRLLMAALTHPSWPLPIWRSLQTRNRLIQHHPIVTGERYDLTTAAGGWRVLDKGVETELHTRLMKGDLCVWESIATFYYRGRFGPQTAHGDNRGAPSRAPAPVVLPAPTWQGRVDASRRWQFARMTGDYNGIHQWDAYARLSGFRAAFAHSQRIVAQGLAQLPAPTAQARRLDLWIKGPLYYGSRVALRHWRTQPGDAVAWGVWVENDDRAALVGSMGAPA